MISVIVPVYNVEAYLRECLDSLLAQTYQNLEVILVDDGSTDRSGEICDEYAAKYNNFTVIHKKNAGLGMARNTGLEHSSGEYITFVDSDDYLDANCIEKLYEAMIKNQVDFCKAGFRRIYNDKTIAFMVQYENRQFEGEKAKEELLPRMIGSRPDMKDSIEPCVWCALYDATIIREHGLKFPSERELIAEDIMFNIDYLQYAKSACTIDDIIYNYRMNNNSLTKSYRSERFDACCHFYKEAKKKLNQFNYDELTMLRLSRIFFVYLRMCISQETKEISSLTVKQNIRNIKRICDDNTVRDSIATYPVKSLGLKQKVFLHMIRYRMPIILYILARLKIF